MTDLSKLPGHISSLFTPRPPIKFAPPLDNPPQKRRTMVIQGIGGFVKAFEETKDDGYVPTESWLQKQQQQKKEKKEANERKLQQAIAEWDPSKDLHIRGDPYRTLMVARLAYDVTESDLENEFSRFGPIERVRVVKDQENKSRGYAFIVFERERDMTGAKRAMDGARIHGRAIKTDVERGRTVRGWKPQRLGGGLGGRHYTKPFVFRSGRPGGGGFRSDRRGAPSGDRFRSGGAPREDDFRRRGPPPPPPSSYRERDRDPRDRDRDRERDRERERDRDRDRDHRRYDRSAFPPKDHRDRRYGPPPPSRRRYDEFRREASPPRSRRV